MDKNRESIQILRGSRGKVAENKTKIRPGQPVFDKTDNYLFVGSGDNSINQPITTNRIIGYYGDSSGIQQTAQNQYSIKPDDDSIAIKLDAGVGYFKP